MATILSMYITKGKKEKLQVAQCAIGKAKVSFSALLLSRTEGLLCVLVEKTLPEAVDCILNDIHTRDKIMNFMKLFLVMSLYISLCLTLKYKLKANNMFTVCGYGRSGLIHGHILLSTAGILNWGQYELFWRKTVSFALT